MTLCVVKVINKDRIVLENEEGMQKEVVMPRHHLKVDTMMDEVDGVYIPNKQLTKERRKEMNRLLHRLLKK